jgi:hypothetical protein
MRVALVLAACAALAAAGQCGPGKNREARHLGALSDCV